MAGTGLARLNRDWDTLSEVQRALYTTYVLKANVNLAAMRDRLNQVCGAYRADQANLTLQETQEVRSVIELLAKL